ncbi:hypothetical protein HGA06_18930, partial [Streptomyces somaliensis DSM 40738]|nr:hypothetical protein [Streptomyces somaliensis DSM 40738]
MSPHDRSVDQIVFRWDTDNLSGTTGFGPVACSCAPERADAVFRVAAPLLRATGEATAPALLRLENGDRVLLVHRAPWREAGGRAGTVCHALMGPAALLDPATCLGLHPWSWEGGDLPLAEVRGTLPPVPESALLPAADAGTRLLSGGLAGVRHELVGAVAEFLRHPKAGFTFLDPSGGAAHRVLWGLHGLFGGQTARRWTFATHDTVESDLLRFVFVSRWTGEASGSGARRRADPVERCGDRAESVAERLVRHHLRDEYEVGAALRRAVEHHRATRGGPVTWLALAEAALSGPPPLDRPSDRIPPRPSERPPDRVPSRPAAPPSPRTTPAAVPRQGPPVPVAAPEWPAPPEGRPRTRRWPGGGSPRRRGPADGELLDALRAGTGGYEALTALMREVADRWPSWNRERRAALCAVLLDQELFVTDRAGALGAADEVRAANAASLYRWAVRPLLDDPALSARVTDLLPRLSTSPHRAARAAVRRITQNPSPGLPEPTWQALLRAATRPPRDVGGPGDHPHRPAGRPAEAGRPVRADTPDPGRAPGYGRAPGAPPYEDRPGAAWEDRAEEGRLGGGDRRREDRSGSGRSGGTAPGEDRFRDDRFQVVRPRDGRPGDARSREGRPHGDRPRGGRSPEDCPGESRFREGHPREDRPREGRGGEEPAGPGRPYEVGPRRGGGAGPAGPDRLRTDGTWTGAGRSPDAPHRPGEGWAEPGTDDRPLGRHLAPRPEDAAPPPSATGADPGVGPQGIGAGPRDAGAGPRDTGVGPRDAGAGPRHVGAAPGDTGDAFRRPGIDYGTTGRRTTDHGTTDHRTTDHETTGTDRRTTDPGTVGHQTTDAHPGTTGHRTADADHRDAAGARPQAGAPGGGSGTGPTTR